MDLNFNTFPITAVWTGKITREKPSSSFCFSKLPLDSLLGPQNGFALYPVLQGLQGLGPSGLELSLVGPRAARARNSVYLLGLREQAQSLDGSGKGVRVRSKAKIQSDVVMHGTRSWNSSRSSLGMNQIQGRLGLHKTFSPK